jgi:hypothetical protein
MRGPAGFIKPFNGTKRPDLTPRQLEVLDWIEDLIVPVLVEKYIEERVLNKKVIGIEVIRSG